MSKELKEHFHWVTIVFIIFLVCIVLYLHFRVTNLEEANFQGSLSHPVEVAYPGAHFECMKYVNKTSLKITEPWFTSDCEWIIFDYCNKKVSEELNCNTSGCLYTEYMKRHDECTSTFKPIMGRAASDINFMKIPPELTMRLIQGCLTNFTIENVTDYICTKEVLVRDVANSASEAVYYG